jgi:hypothetical protein
LSLSLSQTGQYADFFRPARHFAVVVFCEFLVNREQHLEEATDDMGQNRQIEMRLARRVCGVLFLGLLVLCQGCEGPFWRPVETSSASAWGEPAWGEAVEGLQCRLRPDKRVWQTDEIPTFKLDIRNRGERIFAFLPSQQAQLCRIQFDGTWHRAPEPPMVAGAVWPLAPGLDFHGLPVRLDDRFGLDLRPGRHVVRVSFSLEGIEVVSNPVGLEIVPQP